MGIMNVLSRIKLYKGDIEIKSQKYKGTTFKITIPLKTSTSTGF
jgi:signal transduction histidine kinase